MKTIELKQGMCISCLEKPITKHGLMCDACAEPYEGFVGDNEQKNPERFMDRYEFIELLQQERAR